jgi:hypothetical protein
MDQRGGRKIFGEEQRSGRCQNQLVGGGVVFLLGKLEVLKVTGVVGIGKNANAQKERER